jgi:hypothetical protein
VFFDKNIYTNPYGIAFFGSAGDYSDNPYISPAYAGMPGILDDYFDDGIPVSSDSSTQSDMQNEIMKNIPQKFIKKTAKYKQNSARTFECLYDGCLTTESGSVILQYGAVVPSVICITGDVISAFLPFSPISHITFSKGKRTLQTVEYPVSHVPFLPPENIAIDFAVTCRKLDVTLDCDLYGSAEIAYTTDIGATKCESSKIKLEFFQAD